VELIEGRQTGPGDPKDSRSQPKFVHVMPAAVAKHYSENLREEVKMGNARKVQARDLFEPRCCKNNSAFPGSGFQAFNPSGAAPQEINSSAAAKMVANGYFASFVTDLLVSTASARLCLPARVSLSDDCSQKNAANDIRTTELARHIEAELRNQYQQASQGDLDAYVAYMVYIWRPTPNSDVGLDGEIELVEDRAATAKIMMTVK
jgi:hypothetical protein